MILAIAGQINAIIMDDYTSIPHLNLRMLVRTSFIPLQQSFRYENRL
jgi:hypothetical protein